jgi:hypothetical protein
MAWTTPRTWTDGELVTKAIMDPHVRDNLLSLGPIVRVRKTADQSVVGSTTLVNDTHLTFPVAANDVWAVTWRLVYNAPTAGDLKIAWTFPTSGVLDASFVWLDSALAIGQNGGHSTTSPTTAVNLGGTGTFVGPVAVETLFVNSTNAGNLQLQWAQVTASGTTTLVSGSSVTGWKLN